MGRNYLGEFELIVLLVLIHLGDKGYGVSISKELTKQTGREAALGSVYAALERLEQKDYVVSNLADPTPERGGRAKRYFAMTKKGKAAVRMTKTTLTKLWQGIPEMRGEMHEVRTKTIGRSADLASAASRRRSKQRCVDWRSA